MDNKKITMGLLAIILAVLAVPMIVTLGGSTPVPSKTAELRAQQADLDETLSQLKLRQVELELALSGVKEDIAEVRKQRDELEKQIVDTINSPLTTAPVSPNQSQ